MRRGRVAITGIGAVSAAGIGTDALWAALRAGQSGLGRLTLFESRRYGHVPVAEVRGDVRAASGLRRGSRSDHLGVAALREAWATAGLGAGVAGVCDPGRVGVSVGATVGGSLGSEEFLGALLDGGHPSWGVLRHHECGSTAGAVASLTGASGPVATVSTACSAGALAIGLGVQWIRSGRADVVLAGGADSLCRLTLHGFGSLLLLDAEGCRPFDAARGGISLGEGGAFLVLEAGDHAERRGARVLAFLDGWGATCDAHHATAPDPEGEGAYRAMADALAMAGLGPSAIGYVNAHGTGTADNDRTEAKALVRLFSGALPAVSSTKRFLGHTLGAAGALEAVLGVLALTRGGLPANLGLDCAEEGLGFTPLGAFQEVDVEHIMSNSFGFGGNNASLLLSGAGTSDVAGEASAAAARGGVSVRGMGVVGPGGHGGTEALGRLCSGMMPPTDVSLPDPLPTGTVRTRVCGEFGAADCLAAGRRRRLGRLQQMAVVAARRAMEESGEQGSGVAPGRVCVSVGTGWGHLAAAVSFMENTFRHHEQLPQPMQFTNSVHNALASQVAIELGAKGMNLTTTQPEISFWTALWQAANALRDGRADRAVAGAADEAHPYWLAAGARWGRWAGSGQGKEHGQGAAGVPPGEGAAMFVLEEGAVPGCAVVRGIWTGVSHPGAAEEGDRVETLMEGWGVAPGAVRLVLTGGTGGGPLEPAYRAFERDWARRHGDRSVIVRYKEWTGDHDSASALGFAAAAAWVGGCIGVCKDGAAAENGLGYGRLAAEGRMCGASDAVLIYSLSPGGACAVCCLSAPGL